MKLAHKVYKIDFIGETGGRRSVGSYCNVQLRNPEWVRWKLRKPSELRIANKSGINKIENVRCESEELHNNNDTTRTLIEDRNVLLTRS